jgi:hypothetical protein
MCTNQIANLEGVKLELWAYEDEAAIEGTASNGMSLLQVQDASYRLCGRSPRQTGYSVADMGYGEIGGADEDSH